MVRKDEGDRRSVVVREIVRDDSDRASVALVLTYHKEGPKYIVASFFRNAKNPA